MSLLYSRINTMEEDQSSITVSSARSMSDTTMEEVRRRQREVGVNIKRRLSSGLSKLALFKT